MIRVDWNGIPLYQRGVYYIYGLRDPRSGKIRYVGMTGNARGRYVGHLGEKGNTPKCRWVNELRSIGMNPEFVVLERCDSYLPGKEQEWIQRVALHGGDALNVHLTGRTREEKLRRLGAR